MSAPAKSRGPYAKSAEQRRRILEVAMDVFGRLGNRGSSLREIADKVGMSQAGVLHHFGSKSQLLMAVLEERDQVGADDPSLTLAESAASLREMLAAAIANPGLTQLFSTVSAEATDPEHPAHDLIAERYARTRAVFAQPLRRAQQSGELSPEVDVDAVAQLLIAAMDGLQLQRLLDPEVDVLGAFDVLLDVLGTSRRGVS